MDELAIYKRRFERERQARKQAEAILEAKALDLYNANEKLRKLNENLEQKVKERTEDFKAAKLAAEAAQEAEKQFLARMSHEIRTPLNAIIGMTHLLYDTQPNAQQRDYLDSLRISADILLKLISDILDISKIGAGEIHINEKEFDLSGVLWALQKTFQLKSHKEAVEIIIEIDQSIDHILIGDELLLNQILLNLIGNAIKFTHEGTVGVRVKKGKKINTKTKIEFEVFDTGIGIPASEIDKVFERFKQVQHGKQYIKDGTGLGLAICKKLVELQGGEISVKSELGVGTSFRFYLPLLETNQKAIQAPINEDFLDNDFKSNHHLLIVEDNLMNQKYIINLLKKWEIRYQLAHDGTEAVEKAKTTKFDLILMDISMPIMDGYEATILIRNHRNPNQDTPIVALTASALMSQKNKSISVGMNDFLTKPFNPNQLQALLEKYTTPSLAKRAKPLISKESFCFSSQLDSSYLVDLYGDDLEYAADMFETFLAYSVKELPSLRPLIEEGDFEKSRQLAHKLKPTFAMVGLLALQQKMLLIETMASEKKALPNILLKLDEVEQQVKKFIPVLETQLQEMQAII